MPDCVEDQIEGGRRVDAVGVRAATARQVRVGEVQDPGHGATLAAFSLTPPGHHAAKLLLLLPVRFSVIRVWLVRRLHVDYCRVTGVACC
ncbi:hypothetical protein Pen01_02240 [Phytomonospora endophytica]|nr:hypothetical protein Pen01_02240 [Phytomonospora endophytica]